MTRKWSGDRRSHINNQLPATDILNHFRSRGTVVSTHDSHFVLGLRDPTGGASRRTLFDPLKAMSHESLA